MEKQSRRGFMRTVGRLAAVGAGALVGGAALATAAKADAQIAAPCAVYCRYQYFNNEVGNLCHMYRCTNACDGHVSSYCGNNHGSGFCYRYNNC